MLLSIVVALVLLCSSCVSAFSSSLSYKNGSNEIIRCIDKETKALLDFRDGLKVTSDPSRLPPWDLPPKLPSWNSKDCCKWGEVECSNKTGHVIKLKLRGLVGLVGKISPSLLELRELTYLDLGSIDFENSPIPLFFGSFTKLKFLDLSYCNFSGIIPPLGNLSNLNYLNLSPDAYHLDPYNAGNLSVENIDWLSHLSSLQILNMNNIDLSRATNWVDVINSLPFLKDLSLSNCQLSKFISDSSSSSSSSISSSSVQSLDLSYNLLEGMIPNSFRNLCNLERLDLRYNSLSGNLSHFLDVLSGSRCTSMPALERLLVDNNKLYGPLPDGIIRFSSLRQLRLSNNHLNGTLTKNLGTLSQLDRLDLSSNSLIGTLSEAHFSNLSHLNDLDLSGNALHIKVSPQWSPPFQLKYIRLRSCKLGPHFPNWIRTQINSYDLDISNTGISDNIPPWFWDLLKQSEYLNLSSNNFGGILPDLSSKKLQLYPKFDLSSNNFEGPIPLFPSNLSSINLSGNKFSGTLDFLCQLSNVSFSILDISHNLVTGGLPDCLGKLEGLTVVNLAHNRLSGEIPSSVGSLFRLESLYLYNNSFTGELPLSLSNCVRLIFLDVGLNMLTGNVPAWIGGNVSQLHVLSLRSNKFNGTIPLNLCHLNKLQVLDLSLNNLQGTIPPCLNNLSAMVHQGIELNNHIYIKIPFNLSDDYFYTDYSVIGWQGKELEFGNNLRLLKLIDLSSNNLSGEIPYEITKLFELVALNLSRNVLQGKVPQQIGQLKSIQSLDLSRNKFSGKIPVSLSQLSFLNYLNLSYNKFSGKIPSSTQIQSQDESNFVGNVGLCGPPLLLKCLGDESPHTVIGSEENDEDEFLKWLYIGMASGFVTGFWGICGALLLNRRCRHAFFRFTNDLMDWVYVKIATCKF